MREISPRKSLSQRTRSVTQSTFRSISHDINISRNSVKAGGPQIGDITRFPVHDKCHFAMASDAVTLDQTLQANEKQKLVIPQNLNFRLEILLNIRISTKVDLASASLFCESGNVVLDLRICFSWCDLFPYTSNDDLRGLLLSVDNSAIIFLICAQFRTRRVCCGSIAFWFHCSRFVFAVLHDISLINSVH